MKKEMTARIFRILTTGATFSALVALCGCSGNARLGQATANQNNGTQPTLTGNQVMLNWSANKGEQQGFYVEESTDGVNFTQVATVPDGTTTATLTVSSTAGISFRVRGYNQAGASPSSAIATTP